MKKLTSRLFVVIAALSMSACALTVDTVEVPYQEPTSKISVGADGKAFQVSVLDLRAKYKGRIGAKINGFGTEMADIKSTLPVRDIVSNALKSELKARNITISDQDAKSVEAEVVAFHNNFKFGVITGEARAIITINMKVKNGSGTIIYVGNVTEVNQMTGILAATGENAALALEGALQRTMRSLFNDSDFVKALKDA